MLKARKNEILRLISQYNLDDSDGPPLSPFIARQNGILSQVSEKIGVSVEELDECLTLISLELPSDY